MHPQAQALARRLYSQAQALVLQAQAQRLRRLHPQAQVLQLQAMASCLKYTKAIKLMHCTAITVLLITPLRYFLRCANFLLLLEELEELLRLLEFELPRELDLLDRERRRDRLDRERRRNRLELAGERRCGVRDVCRDCLDGERRSGVRVRRRAVAR